MLTKGIIAIFHPSPLPLLMSILTVSCPGAFQEHPTEARVLHVQNC